MFDDSELAAKVLTSKVLGYLPADFSASCEAIMANLGSFRENHEERVRTAFLKIQGEVKDATPAQMRELVDLMKLEETVGNALAKGACHNSTSRNH